MTSCLTFAILTISSINKFKLSIYAAGTLILFNYYFGFFDYYNQQSFVKEFTWWAPDFVFAFHSPPSCSSMTCCEANQFSAVNWSSSQTKENSYQDRKDSFNMQQQPNCSSPQFPGLTMEIIFHGNLTSLFQAPPFANTGDDRVPFNCTGSFSCTPDNYFKRAYRHTYVDYYYLPPLPNTFSPNFTASPTIANNTQPNIAVSVVDRNYNIFPGELKLRYAIHERWRRKKAMPSIPIANSTPLSPHNVIASSLTLPPQSPNDDQDIISDNSIYRGPIHSGSQPPDSVIKSNSIVVNKFNLGRANLSRQDSPNTGIPTNYQSPTTPPSMAIELTLLVKSSRQNVERRNVIRKTWGAPTFLRFHNGDTLKVRSVFLLGLTPELWDATHNPETSSFSIPGRSSKSKILFSKSHHPQERDDANESTHSDISRESTGVLRRVSRHKKSLSLSNRIRKRVYLEQPANPRTNKTLFDSIGNFSQGPIGLSDYHTSHIFHLENAIATNNNSRKYQNSQRKSQKSLFSYPASFFAIDSGYVSSRWLSTKFSSEHHNHQTGSPNKFAGPPKLPLTDWGEVKEREARLTPISERKRLELEHYYMSTYPPFLLPPGFDPSYLYRENKTDDIIIGDFVDHYYNNTIKTLLGIKWYFSSRGPDAFNKGYNSSLTNYGLGVIPPFRIKYKFDDHTKPNNLPGANKPQIDDGYRYFYMRDDELLHSRNCQIASQFTTSICQTSKLTSPNAGQSLSSNTLFKALDRNSTRKNQSTSLQNQTPKIDSYTIFSIPKVIPAIEANELKGKDSSAVHKFVMIIDDDYYLSIVNLYRYIRHNLTTDPKFFTDPTAESSFYYDRPTIEPVSRLRFRGGFKRLRDYYNRHHLRFRPNSRSEGDHQTDESYKHGSGESTHSFDNSLNGPAAGLSIHSQQNLNSGDKTRRGGNKDKSTESNRSSGGTDPTMTNNITNKIFTNVYCGYVFKASMPHRLRSSKWFIGLDTYPYDVYPPYVTGGAILMSHDVALHFYHLAPLTKKFVFDDIYLSILALKLKINPIHNPDFVLFPSRNPEVDLRHKIASHGFNDPEKLYRLWHQLNNRTSILLTDTVSEWRDIENNH